MGMSLRDDVVLNIVVKDSTEIFLKYITVLYVLKKKISWEDFLHLFNTLNYNRVKHSWSTLTWTLYDVSRIEACTDEFITRSSWSKLNLNTRPLSTAASLFLVSLLWPFT